MLARTGTGIGTAMYGNIAWLQLEACTSSSLRGGFCQDDDDVLCCLSGPKLRLMKCRRSAHGSSRCWCRLPSERLPGRAWKLLSRLCRECVSSVVRQGNHGPLLVSQPGGRHDAVDMEYCATGVELHCGWQGQ